MSKRSFEKTTMGNENEETIRKHPRLCTDAVEDGALLSEVINSVILPCYSQLQDVSALILLIDTMLVQWKRGAPLNHELVEFPHLFVCSKTTSHLVRFFLVHCVIPDDVDAKQTLTATLLKHAMVCEVKELSDTIVRQVLSSFAPAEMWLPAIYTCRDCFGEGKVCMNQLIGTEWQNVSNDERDRTWGFRCFLLCQRTEMIPSNLAQLLAGVMMTDTSLGRIIPVSNEEHAQRHRDNLQLFVKRWSCHFPQLATDVAHFDPIRSLTGTFHCDRTEAWDRLDEGQLRFTFNIGKILDKRCESNVIMHKLVGPCMGYIHTLAIGSRQPSIHSNQRMLNLINYVGGHSTTLLQSDIVRMFLNSTDEDMLSSLVSSVVNLKRQQLTPAQNIIVKKAVNVLCIAAYSPSETINSYVVEAATHYWTINPPVLGEGIDAFMKSHCFACANVAQTWAFSTREIYDAFISTVNPNKETLGSYYNVGQQKLYIPASPERAVNMAMDLPSVDDLLHTRLIHETNTESEGFGVTKVWFKQLTTQLFGPDNDKPLAELEEYAELVGALLVWHTVAGVKFPVYIPSVYVVPSHLLKQDSTDDCIRRLAELDVEVTKHISSLLKMDDHTIASVGLFQEDHTPVNSQQDLPRFIRSELRSKTLTCFQQKLRSGVVKTLASKMTDSLLAWDNAIKLWDKSFGGSQLKEALFGECVFPLDKMRTQCAYQPPAFKDSEQVRWFWEVMENECDDKMRFAVYQFITTEQAVGQNNISIVEFHDATEHMLPQTATCFNTFKLPPYKSRAQLAAKLKIAVLETSHDQLTIR